MIFVIIIVRRGLAGMIGVRLADDDRKWRMRVRLPIEMGMPD